jgi:ArsR family transcriptional regulator
MSDEKSFEMELFFAALADRTRLRLLNLMRDAEVCVCFFVEVIGTNQPKISRHLAYLRKAGIVAARRDGIWAHYRIIEPSNEDAAKVLRDVQEWLKSDSEMQKDRKQLATVCCAAQPPVSIQGAPRPISISANIK